MDSEITTSMVPPSNPGSSLGSTPNRVLSMTQDNFPAISHSNSNNKRQRHDSDDDPNTSAYFKSIDNFARFLIIKSDEGEDPITNLSPFVIEKQIEAILGTPKSVKKLKNKTLLVETNRKTQTENLLKVKKFFNLNVTVSEHKTLNTSKGIIKDRALKGETEANICEYLQSQGVIAVKRFTIKKNYDTIPTNTLLLTFNSVTVPKSLKIFYRVISVEIYVPNPLRCFNCQRFGHHESDCPVDYASVCDKCGTGGFDHIPSNCKNPVKCVNCGLDHLSRSNECEIWKKEKEIMRVKVTNNITYIEARKMVEQKPEDTFSRIVQSTMTKTITKPAVTQFSENDFIVSASTKTITPTKYKKSNKPKTSQQPSTSKPNTNSQTSSSQPNKPTDRESRARSRTNARKDSQSPKSRKKDTDRNIKITRVPDNSVKTDNKFASLTNSDQMEAEEYVDNTSSTNNNK